MLRIKHRSETVPNPVNGERLPMFPDQRQLHWRESENDKWTRIAWISLKPKTKIAFIRFFADNQRQEIVRWVEQELQTADIPHSSVPDPSLLPPEIIEHDDGDDDS